MAKPPVLALLVFSSLASGISALGYELLWGRELALTFGGSQYAVATVLSAFMLGLGLGSGLGGWIADRTRRPAGVACVLELTLTVVGPLVSIGLIHLPEVAASLLPGSADATRGSFLIGRFAVGVATLVPATMLMGASFPLLARAIGSTVSEFHRGIGWLYAAATLGGVLGAVGSGFVLVPSFGIPGAAAAAAVASLVAALCAAAAQLRLGQTQLSSGATSVRGRHVSLNMSWLLAAAAVSGALVLGAETLWHRALMLVLANSTATLTILLALTLIGLSVGATFAAPLIRRQRSLRYWSVLQLAVAAILATQAAFLPQLAAAVRFLRPDHGWARVLIPPAIVGGGLVLPATILLGAAWPLLLAAATPRLEDGGRRLGLMGVVNSIGAAFGAACVGFMALPALGFGRATLLLAACHAALSGFGMRFDTGSSRRGLRRAILWASALLFALVAFAPHFGRVLLPSVASDPHTVVLDYRESPAGTVVVTEHLPTAMRAMFVDNNAVIGSSYDALKVVRILGLAPGLLHRDPERVLVIGFGAGVTTATIAGVPGVDHIDVAEIVPEVATAARFFTGMNHGIVDDPRVRMSSNDGRNYLLLRETSYDVITCDPVHPLYGSAPLYSIDFFRMCRTRLRPGGLVCQYLPLHRMPTPDFRRTIGTFQSVFAETWVLFGIGHAVLVGSDGPLHLDWKRWQSMLDLHPLKGDLATSALASPTQIAALLHLDPEASARVAAGSPSSDLYPHLEFLLPDAYVPGLWASNARLLVEHYRSPLDRIEGLPLPMRQQIRRLVAGKRLLLFSMLERDAGNPEGTLRWLRQALAIADDDPELRFYAHQVQEELKAINASGMMPDARR